jgi:hypothetical protein
LTGTLGFFGPPADFLFTNFDAFSTTLFLLVDFNSTFLQKQSQSKQLSLSWYSKLSSSDEEDEEGDPLFFL